MAVPPTPAEAFRASFFAMLRRRAGDDPALAAFAAGLADTRCLPGRPGAGGYVPGGARPHLDRVLAPPDCDPALARAIRDFAPTVNWYRILEGAEVDPALVDGLLVGRPELPADAAIRLGLFLIAPGVYYPLHQHAALEVYFVVSGRIEIEHGLERKGRWFGPGEHSVTPCYRVHALRTGDAPCLIAYVWTGNLAAPAWWWARDESGWHRTRWERAASGRWSRAATEPVTAATLAEAGEAMT